MHLSTGPARYGTILGRCCLVAVPLILYGVTVAHPAKLGFDLHVFWEAARAVGHGISPYDPSGVAHMRLAEQRDMGARPLAAWAVYPPALFVVLIPLGVLPWPIAAVVGISLLALAPALALRVMGVRDWRCYVIAYSTAPVYTAISIGTISTLLMLGFALVWRGRGTLVACAATVVAKLLLWPLAAIVAATEGMRRAALLAAVSVALVLVPWVLIGFADIERYPRMLNDLSTIEAHNSFSATGLAFALGLPLALGTYAGLLLGLTLAALAFRAGRHGNRDVAFTLALVAALLASPIVWMHYLALIFLPIAARFPRLNVVWLIPVVLWMHEVQAADGATWAFILVWSCVAVITTLSLSSKFPKRIGISRPSTRVDRVVGA